MSSGSLSFMYAGVMTKRKKSESAEVARAAILEAAERHFAQHGLGMSSVRAIASAAQVNSAMLGYYFGPKEALIRELVSAASQKICAWRISALEELHAQHGDVIPTVETIRVYAEPFLVESHALAETVKIYLRVVGQAMSEPENRLSDHVHEQFVDSHQRFAAEIARSIPDLSASLISSRYCMMVGAMVAISAGREWAPGTALFSRSIHSGSTSEMLSRFSEEWSRIFSLPA